MENVFYKTDAQNNAVGCRLNRRYEMQFVDGVGSCFVTVHMVYFILKRSEIRPYSAFLPFSI